MFAFHVQDCGRPRYEVRNWPLHFLFLLSASLGHEIFYITCLPNIHWSVDPFLCRRLLNMWAVSRSWRECVFVCECVCICQSDCISVHKPPVWCLFPSQCHISSLCFSAFFSLHLSTSFHPCPPPLSSDLSLTPSCTYIPRPWGGGHRGQPDQDPWHGERPHMRTHQWESTVRSSPSDVYSGRIERMMTLKTCQTPEGV